MYIVINGGGKVASYLAQTMISHGHDVAVIEKRPDIADRLSHELPDSALIILGDGCDAVFQDDAGVSRADVFVSATGDDDDNLVACQLARVAFGVPRTVARVNNPKNERIFTRLGIEAISSTTIIARLIEEEAVIGDIKTLAMLRRGDLSIMETDLPKDSCRVCGVRVADLDLPVECVLVAVVRGDEVTAVSGDTVLDAGDTIIAITKSEYEPALKRALAGE